MEKQYYSNIFLLSSTMWSGNVVEYFSPRTKKLVVFYFLPRWDKNKNFIRTYEDGKIKEQYVVYSPKNIIIQYIVLFFQTILVITRHFKRSEHIFIISYHPYVFLIKWPLLIFRKCDIVFWIVDYFPSPNLQLKIYQSCITFFHKRNKFNIYLSNRLNRIMNNGAVMNTENRSTVMWGVKKSKKQRKKDFNKINLYYNGVIREEHSFEIIFQLIKEHNNIYIKLLGKCDKNLYKKYKKLIKEFQIGENVYFPNRYFSEKELADQSKYCHVAIALYKVDRNSYVYYADPGKIKLYSELGLPIIMTRSSEVANYIKRFSAGELVEQNITSLYNAITLISNNYDKYIEGVNKFTKHFYYKDYYQERFKFLEK